MRRELVKQAVSRGCLLCDAPAAVGAIFKPDDPVEYGAPAGKVRFLHYALCRDCYEQDDEDDRLLRIGQKIKVLALRVGP